jgi:hypothetical protein
VTGASARRWVLGIPAAGIFLANWAAAEPPVTDAKGERLPEKRTGHFESAGSVAERLVAEFMVGSGFATLGFLAGSKVVNAACSTCVFAASFAGANVTFPVGVYAGGRLVRGKGNFWLTVSAPWLVSLTTIVALAREEDHDGRPAFEIGTIGGTITAPLSMALFELSHSWAARPATGGARARLPVHVGLSRSQHGVGVIVGGPFP